MALLRMYKAGILMVLCLLSATVYGQKDTLRVSVRAYAGKDGIRLRWAVNSAQAWRESNRYGVRVERYTVVRNGQMLASPEKVVLTPMPLKPRPLNDWQALATADNYAAVIAQALYGEQFQLSGDDAKGVSKLIALAQEAEQRYLVSSYAADRSYAAALLAGWGFHDTTAKAGERYLYRVIPERGGKLPTQFGAAYISLADYEPLPKPQELTGAFGDKSVMLTWNYSLLGDVYNAYYIERSEDGREFRRISDTPVTNINGRDGKPHDRIYYMDTLAANNVMLHYRVLGISAFGEVGPPSDTVRGVGKSRLIYVPHIQRSMVNEAGTAEIAWEFDARGNNQIRSFSLERSENSKGPFSTVIENIGATERSISYPNLKGSNYFVVTAQPINGEPVRSLPVLIQLADTIPPAAPTALIGVVDTLGRVRLSWAANTEPDMLGYRLYRSQTQGEEMVPITDVAIRGTTYIDTISVRTLNSSVYYAITALDQRYNQSGKSPVATLRRPDMVPPSPPLITGYRSEGNAIQLTWVTGGEENIASLRLYRQPRGGKKTLLKEFRDRNAIQYSDSTVKSDLYYQYSLVAVTEGGLASAASPAITVQAGSASTPSSAVTGFAAVYSRKHARMELTWKHTPSGIKQIELYKSEAGQALTLWKVIQGFEQGTDDTNVEAGKTYHYMIRTILTSGKNGSVAKTVSR